MRCNVKIEEDHTGKAEKAVLTTFSSRKKYRNQFVDVIIGSRSNSERRAHGVMEVFLWGGSLETETCRTVLNSLKLFSEFLVNVC